ncbi:hypothetical protein Y032_0038g3548 [Ancylostoma ceylanicum]|uniref:Uncharacterized protein n=1 Tax=Ancylostoma ceylanicum TaxID=53326 RepID=A0A016UIF7_9BILA|nr:hypothetical protein Y032_0038g3548 [Ancylostoma ceylanicum]
MIIGSWSRVTLVPSLLARENMTADWSNVRRVFLRLTRARTGVQEMSNDSNKFNLDGPDGKWMEFRYEQQFFGKRYFGRWCGAASVRKEDLTSLSSLLE